MGNRESYGNSWTTSAGSTIYHPGQRSQFQNPGDRAAASRREQMKMQDRMMREQEYNRMRTDHLERELVEQEIQEEDEDIYYLLT